MSRRGMGDDEKNPCGLNMENKNKNKNHLNDDHSLDSFLRNITCPNISLCKFAEIIK